MTFDQAVAAGPKKDDMPMVLLALAGIGERAVADVMAAYSRLRKQHGMSADEATKALRTHSIYLLPAWACVLRVSVLVVEMSDEASARNPVIVDMNALALAMQREIEARLPGLPCDAGRLTCAAETMVRLDGSAREIRVEAEA